MSRKIFEIGFNKCATRAVYVLLRSAGIPSRHWDRGAIALDIKNCIENGTIPLQKYEGIEFFSDMVYTDSTSVFEAYKAFEYLDKTFPNSLFVYNLRDIEAWLKSRIKHGNGFELNIYKSHLGLETDEDVINAWRQDWYSHKENVINYFTKINGMDRLLFIDIDKPDFDEISKFIGKDVDRSNWEVIGKTKA